MVLLLRDPEILSAMEAMEASFTTFRQELKNCFSDFETLLVAHFNTTTSTPPPTEPSSPISLSSVITASATVPTSPITPPSTSTLTSQPTPLPTTATTTFMDCCVRTTIKPRQKTTNSPIPPPSEEKVVKGILSETPIVTKPSPPSIPAFPSLQQQPTTFTQPTSEDLLRKLEIAMSVSAVPKSDIGVIDQTETLTSSEPSPKTKSLAFSVGLDDAMCRSLFHTGNSSPSLPGTDHHRLPLSVRKCPFSPSLNIASSRDKSEENVSTHVLKSLVLVCPNSSQIGLTGPILRVLYGRAIITLLEEPPGLSKLKTRDLEWYYFTMLDKKYGNGVRGNRTTEKVYWKTARRDKAIKHKSLIVGMKKTLVYHMGHAPKGQRTPSVEERWLDDKSEIVSITEMAEVVDFGDDAYLDGYDLEQILVSDVPSVDSPLPSNLHAAGISIEGNTESVNDPKLLLNANNQHDEPKQHEDKDLHDILGTLFLVHNVSLKSDIRLAHNYHIFKFGDHWCELLIQKMFIRSLTFNSSCGFVLWYEDEGTRILHLILYLNKDKSSMCVIILPGFSGLECRYAVCSEIVNLAQKLQEEMKVNPRYHPFIVIIYCNIGNPQSLGQQPTISFREVLALCEHPASLDKIETLGIFSVDVTHQILDQILGRATGTYSHSHDIKEQRDSILHSVEAGDGFPGDTNDAFLIDGASPAVHMMMQLSIRSKSEGILCHVPQNPLYATSIALYRGTLIPYYLEEAITSPASCDPAHMTSVNALAVRLLSYFMVKETNALVTLVIPTSGTWTIFSTKILCSIGWEFFAMKHVEYDRFWNSLYGVISGGKESRAASARPILGNWGNDYGMASCKLTTLMKAHDGRGPATMLTNCILQSFCLPSPDEIIGWTYADFSWARIATRVPLVVSCHEAGDQIVDEILYNVVQELAISMKVVVGCLFPILRSLSNLSVQLALLQEPLRNHHLEDKVVLKALGNDTTQGLPLAAHQGNQIAEPKL